MGTSSTLLAIAAVVLTAGGCGPSRTRSDPGGPANTGATEVQPASCPATFAEAPLGAACTDTTATCAYAEGRCWCGPTSYCGGAAPPEELLAELARPTWQCKPVRTDGCPEAEPSGACAQEGQVCTYGDCCFRQIVCERGTWVQGNMGCPP